MVLHSTTYLKKEKRRTNKCNSSSIGKEEGKPSMLGNCRGESPQGVEGKGESPAREEVVCWSGPHLPVILFKGSVGPFFLFNEIFQNLLDILDA